MITVIIGMWLQLMWAWIPAEYMQISYNIKNEPSVRSNYIRRFIAERSRHAVPRQPRQIRRKLS